MSEELLRQVNADVWIIGGRLLLCHQTLPGDCSWSDGHGKFFTISKATALNIQSPTCTRVEPRPNPGIQLIHAAGRSHPHAVWKIGEAFLKVIRPLSPGITREHDTLSALREMKLDFTIPDVLYHGEWDDRYYLFLSKIPGQAIHEIWPVLKKEEREDCVRRVASICKQLSVREETFIGGLDGKNIPEFYLTQNDANPDFSRENLLRNCKILGMDCSTFVFYHCDLGPGNIIINPDDKSLGIIDWECAGFVPRAWVRTKFRVCGGMDLEMTPGTDTNIPRHDWRLQMQQRLGKDGFVDVATNWLQWHSYIKNQI